MFNLGPMELGVIVFVALLIFGPSQIPKLGRVFGESIRAFRGVGKELRSGLEIQDDPDDEEEARRQARRGGSGGA